MTGTSTSPVTGTARGGANGLAVAGLVCGIVGLFVLNIILGPLAVIFGGIGWPGRTAAPASAAWRWPR